MNRYPQKLQPFPQGAARFRVKGYPNLFNGGQTLAVKGPFSAAGVSIQLYEPVGTVLAISPSDMTLAETFIPRASVETGQTGDPVRAVSPKLDLDEEM